MLHKNLWGVDSFLRGNIKRNVLYNPVYGCGKRGSCPETAPPRSDPPPRVGLGVVGVVGQRSGPGPRGRHFYFIFAPGAG